MRNNESEGSCADAGPPNQIAFIKSVEMTEAFTSLLLDYQECSSLMTICIIETISLLLFYSFFASSFPPSLPLSLSFSISLADFPLSPVSSISLSLFADGMSLGGRQSALSVECERGQRFQPCADYSKSSFPRVQEIHRQCVSKPFFEGSR